MTYAELRRDYMRRTSALRPAWIGRVWCREFSDELRATVWAAAIEGWPEDSSKASAVRNAKLVLRTRYGIDPITLLLIGAIIQIAVNVIWEWLKRRWDENHAYLREFQRMLLGPN